MPFLLPLPHLMYQAYKTLPVFIAAEHLLPDSFFSYCAPFLAIKVDVDSHWTVWATRMTAVEGATHFANAKRDLFVFGCPFINVFEQLSIFMDYGLQVNIPLLGCNES